MIHDHISSIGILAGPMLQKESGRVAAAFDSTLYLSAGQQLFCVVANHLPCGPLHLNTSVLAFKNVEAGAEWTVQNNQLKIEDCHEFCTTNAVTWAPDIPTHPPPLSDHILETLELLEKLLNDAEPQQPGTTTDVINKRLESGQSALQHWLLKPEHPVPNSLLPMIGCGHGLTPEGDDFLLGAVMALRHLHGESGKLESWLKQHAPRHTSDISYAHLMAACEGFASEPVHNLLCALLSPVVNEQQVVRYSEALLAIGHSSGWQTLRGIVAILKALIKTRSQEVSTG